MGVVAVPMLVPKPLVGLPYGYPEPVICANGHSFTRGGYVAVQQDGLLRVQVHQRARRVA